jgi:hypothetical protein
MPNNPEEEPHGATHHYGSDQSSESINTPLFPVVRTATLTFVRLLAGGAARARPCRARAHPPRTSSSQISCVHDNTSGVSLSRASPLPRSSRLISTPQTPTTKSRYPTAWRWQPPSPPPSRRRSPPTPPRRARTRGHLPDPSRSTATASAPRASAPSPHGKRASPSPSAM